MTNSLHPWRWNSRRELAAQLVADDHLLNAQIAERVGVGTPQLERWKHCPEFTARVAEHVAAFRAQIATSGLALKNNRVQAKKARAAALRGLLRARGAHASMQHAPGTTEAQRGLQVRTWKSIGSGVFAEKVEEFSVDTGLLAELRALEVEIATELGEWKQKVAIEVDGDIMERLIAGRKRLAGSSSNQPSQP